MRVKLGNGKIVYVRPVCKSLKKVINKVTRLARLTRLGMNHCLYELQQPKKRWSYYFYIIWNHAPEATLKNAVRKLRSKPEIPCGKSFDRGNPRVWGLVQKDSLGREFIPPEFRRLIALYSRLMDV